MEELMDHEEKVETLLKDIPREREKDLLHLLDCPECQGYVRDRLAGEAEKAAAESVYDRLLQELEARAPGLLREMEAQKAVALRQMDLLLSAPVAQRTALAGSRDFRNLRLAELLLEVSRSAQPADPARSEGLARLALSIAGQEHGPEQAGRACDVKSRAAALIGNARRLVGDRDGAADWFREAVSHLLCPPDSVERAFYCQMLAALRRDQGREDEAAGLLWRAALVYGENGDLLEEAACLAELGFLFLAEDQPYRALPALTRACQVLELHPDTLLAVRAGLALAVCHASLSHEAQALRTLGATRRLYGRITDSGQMAEVTWLEGKVALLTGNLEDAPDLLDTARRSFLKAGRLYEAVFATLDLVLALSRTKRLRTMRPLIQEIAERFPMDVNQAGALRALSAVETALTGRRGAALEDVVATAVEMLRRFRRNPLLVFEGTPVSDR